MNLNELYQAFKKDHPEIKIGISKFCELRPKNCIKVGSHGSHSVCVCKIHQNVKLMIAALTLTEKVTYHDLIAKMVCSVDSKLCMLHRCSKCPGRNSLQEYFQCKLDSAIFDEMMIHFKHWVSTDRTTLEERIMPTTDFLEMLIHEIDQLTTHHHIANNQSQYLKHLKDTVKPNQEIIILDFAENYSSRLIQGFHWNNSQATLHPFAVYYKECDNKLCNINLCIISDFFRHDAVVDSMVGFNSHSQSSNFSIKDLSPIRSPSSLKIKDLSPIPSPFHGNEFPFTVLQISKLRA